MRLFDEPLPAGRGAPASTAGPFELLARSTRPAAAALRGVYEAWFALYPEPHRTALATALREGDAPAQRRAAFELLVCALLHGAGWEVELRPALAGTAERPDLRAWGPGGRELLVELATVEPERTAQQRQQGLEALRSALDRLPLRSWRVSLSVEQLGTARDEPERIAAAVGRWLATLAPAPGGSAPAAAVMDWDERGWRLRLRASPRQAAGGEDAGSLVTTWSYAPDAEEVARVRGALARHQRSYGRRATPVLVALNVVEAGLDDDLVLDGLLGRLGRGGLEPAVPAVRHGGAGGASGWYGVAGLENRAVSAVWFCEHEPARRPAPRYETLVHVPRARLPLPGAWWPLRQLLVEPAQQAVVAWAGRPADQVLPHAVAPGGAGPAA